MSKFIHEGTRVIEVSTGMAAHYIDSKAAEAAAQRLNAEAAECENITSNESQSEALQEDITGW